MVVALLQRFAELLPQAGTIQYLVLLPLRAVVAGQVSITLALLQMQEVAVLVAAVLALCQAEALLEAREILRQLRLLRVITVEVGPTLGEAAPQRAGAVEQMPLELLCQTILRRGQEEMALHQPFPAVALLTLAEAAVADITQAVSPVPLAAQVVAGMGEQTGLVLMALPIQAVVVVVGRMLPQQIMQAVLAAPAS